MSLNAFFETEDLVQVRLKILKIYIHDSSYMTETAHLITHLVYTFPHIL